MSIEDEVTEDVRLTFMEGEENPRNAVKNCAPLINQRYSQQTQANDKKLLMGNKKH